MNKHQIKEVMSLIRPALRALTGVQKYWLVGYSLVEYKYGRVVYGYFKVRGKGLHRVQVVKIDKDKVTDIYQED